MLELDLKNKNKQTKKAKKPLFLPYYPGQQGNLALKVVQILSDRWWGGGVRREGVHFAGSNQCRLESVDLIEDLSLAEIYLLSLFCFQEAPLLGNGGLEKIKAEFMRLLPLPSPPLLLISLPCGGRNGANLQTSLLFSLLRVHVHPLHTPHTHTQMEHLFELLPFLDIRNKASILLQGFYIFLLIYSLP